MPRPSERRGRGAKGKVHPDAYSAEKTLAHARTALEEGRLVIDDRVYDQLVAMQIPLGDARAAIEAAFQEVKAEHAKPPDYQFDPPGQGFIWDSKRFGCQMYLKVRLEGGRPRCKLYSLHQPVHAVAKRASPQVGRAAGRKE